MKIIQLIATLIEPWHIPASMHEFSNIERGLKFIEVMNHFNIFITQTFENSDDYKNNF
ncbi:MAG: hypothetical protein ACSLE0_02860 [Chitinophagaceae bacterium]